jgi:hypothetical protein
MRSLGGFASEPDSLIGGQSGMVKDSIYTRSFTGFPTAFANATRVDSLGS